MGRPGVRGTGESQLLPPQGCQGVRPAGSLGCPLPRERQPPLPGAGDVAQPTCPTARPCGGGHACRMGKRAFQRGSTCDVMPVLRVDWAGAGGGPSPLRGAGLPRARGRSRTGASPRPHAPCQTSGSLSYSTASWLQTAPRMPPSNARLALVVTSLPLCPPRV